MRLGKFLAHAGVASRRAVEGIVADARVTVDGEVVTDPARDVDGSNVVELDGRRVEPEPREVHALNKPAGVVSTARDTHGRPTVVQLVRSRRRLYPVGRLDADTTGLILLTNDGELAERLTHPRYGVKKVYRARIQPGRLVAAGARGAADGGRARGRPHGAGARAPGGPGVVEITIREGKKRQVRRMLEAVGHRVVELERVAFGPLGLRGLEPGKSRRLTSSRGGAPAPGDAGAGTRETTALKARCPQRRRSPEQLARAAARIPARMKLRALRGAITVDANEADAILAATEELVHEVMDAQRARPGADGELHLHLHRRPRRRVPRGRGAQPRPQRRCRCSARARSTCPGALPRVIRLLLHCYADPDGRPQHVYLREADSLRRDLEGAQ